MINIMYTNGSILSVDSLNHNYDSHPRGHWFQEEIEVFRGDFVPDLASDFFFIPNSILKNYIMAAFDNKFLS